MFVKPFFGKRSEPGKVDGARNRFPWEDTMMRHTRLWVICGLALVSGMSAPVSRWSISALMGWSRAALGNGIKGWSTWGWGLDRISVSGSC